MFRNFIKSSIRALLKDRLNTIINLFGLSVGLACTVLIYLYVKNELSFDNYHEQAGNIYHVYTFDKGEDREEREASTSMLLGPEMVRSLPEVVNQVRMTGAPAKVTLDGKKIAEEISLYDSAFFEVFSCKLIQGSLLNVLDDPHGVVLSEETAQKYFGNNDPIGEQLEIKIANEAVLYTVKAVIENTPPNSTFSYSIIAPYINALQFLPEDMARQWHASFGETYVLLQDQADPEAIAEKMIPVMKNALGEKFEEGKYLVNLRPLKDVHFGQEFGDSMHEVSDIKYVYIIAGIALLILLLASINFTTLSIGKSFARAKEVGVRKVVGSSRAQIIFQFLGESLIMTFLGFALALFLASLVLPWFNDLTGVALRFEIGLVDALIFLAFGVLVGVLSGSYPALLISRFQSYKIIKGDFGSKLKKHNLRKGLVAVQYVIAIAFISITLLMMKQMQFMMNKDLGFDKDQMICVTFESDISQGLKYAAESAIKKGEKLSRAFEGQPGVKSIGFSTNKFNGDSWIRIGSVEKGKEEEMVMLSATFIDPGYIKTLNIEMEQGRSFSALNAADYQNAVIVNEALVKKMGWNNPLDAQLPGRYPTHEIVGVVKDFNYETLHNEIRPLYMTMNPDFMFESINSLSMSSLPETNMYVKLEAGQIQSSIEQLESMALELYPEEPFDFEFLDEAIQTQYEKERSMNKVISSATILAIIISSLGLFGLSFLTINARTKEIGIRKALGASFFGLLYQLSRDYFVVILISTVIAIPIAYLTIQEWLKEFEFRIEVMPQHFIIAILLTFVMSMITISYLTIRSARQNPVDALRYE